jgi:hypothetical protein
MSDARTAPGGGRLDGREWTAGRRGTAAMAALAAALFATAAALLGTGGGSNGHHHAAARVVAVPGGLLRVDAVTPDSPMSMGGMPMPSGPNVKDVPRGYRRFTVSVTLFARHGRGMHVAPGNFRLVVHGRPPRAPIDDDRDDVYVPYGTTYPRELTFDAPEKVTSARLTVAGADEAVVVPLRREFAGREHAHR